MAGRQGRERQLAGAQTAGAGRRGIISVVELGHNSISGPLITPLGKKGNFRDVI